MLKYLYEPFKKWSDGGQVWVYSDPHFEDNDCKLMSEDWPTPQEQIVKINSKVGKNDTIIILGDIGNPEYIKRMKAGYKVLIAGNHDLGLSNYKKTITHEMRKIFAKYINEEQYKKDVTVERKSFHTYLYEIYPYAKIYIQERYEFYSPFKFFDATIDDNLFDEVYGGPLMISDKIILSHEPCGVPWALNIHGHDHNDWAKDSEFPHVNVCSNIIGYTPITLDSIVKSGKVKMVESIHRLAIEKQKLAKI